MTISEIYKDKWEYIDRMGWNDKEVKSLVLAVIDSEIDRLEKYAERNKDTDELVGGVIGDQTNYLQAQHRLIEIF
jgi:hypothetical protein